MAVTLAPAQLEVLRRYLEFEASLEEVRLQLRGILDFNFVAEYGKRFMDCNFPPPIPGIRVTRQHLETALQRRRDRRISEQELVEWATMLFLNQAYFWEEGEDGELIFEWLKNISFDLKPNGRVSQCFLPF
jgi:hypothetical protein